MKKIHLSMSMKILLSIVIILITALLVMKNNQKYRDAQVYQFCYSAPDSEKYSRCYTKDHYSNYSILNNDDNTEIIYDTTTNSKIMLSDGKKIKETQLSNLDIGQIDKNVEKIIESTGIQLDEISNKTVPQENFTDNETFILSNYFPDIKAEDVESIEYKVSENKLTVAEYNNDGSQNYVNFSYLSNDEVEDIEIPE